MQYFGEFLFSLYVQLLPFVADRSELRETSHMQPVNTGKMHKVDVRRSILLPVFDPCYKPTDRRNRLPLIQQQQQEPDHPRHAKSSQRCSGKDPCEKPNNTGEIDCKVSDATVEKEKKLKRKKVMKWRSLNVESNQRQSNNDEGETKGTLLCDLFLHCISCQLSMY